MSGTIEIVVPDIGDFQDVDVIEVLVGEGDRVSQEDPLITLETDKAAMDVPCPAAGRIVALHVSRGDKVSAGSPVASLEPAAEADATPADAREEAGPAAADSVGEPGPAAVASPDDNQPVAALMEVRVPDIGDFTGVDVIDVLVAEGDQIDADDAMITLETDKAAMDVPSPAAGVVAKLSVARGDKISEGDLIAVLKTADEGAGADTGVGEAAADEPPAAAGRPAEQAAETMPPAPQQQAGATGIAAIDEPGFARAHASPSVRKLARELGADLVRIKGTGPKSRILHEDVKSFVKSVMTGAAQGGGGALPALPTVDFAKYGETELRPLSRIQRISGPRLHASWVNIPHVTQFDEADITDLEETRGGLKASAAERGIRLTALAFIIRACVRTLREFPDFNASLDGTGENLVFKKYCHIGFAADTPQGLVVPVIRDADKKDVYELATDLGALSARAREGKLGAADMQGGCFTISSLGGVGGTAFTPIINPPELAILGVSRSRLAPVYIEGEWVPRLMLPLSLSYDHRVIDGVAAVRFTRFLAEALADVKGLLEAVP